MVLIFFVNQTISEDELLSISSVYAQNVSDFNFAAAADFGCTINTENTIYNIETKDPELFLAAGDLSYKDTADCWFEITRSLDSITKIAIGNEDILNSSLLGQYVEHYNLTKTYYSFDYQNVHFTILDSERLRTGDVGQINWLRDDLAKANSDPNINWKIVVYHRNSVYQSLSASLRDPLHPIFDEYGVDLALFGHHHSYERGFPIKYNNIEPSKPIITDLDENTYNDPEGVVYVKVGTGGHSINRLSENPSYYTIRGYEDIGFLDVSIVNQGKTLIGKFHSNYGNIIDQFSITKSDYKSNKSPISIAGNNQIVNEDKVVLLDGSNSIDPDDDPISYYWKVINNDNNTVALQDPFTANPKFISTSANSNGHTLTFELTVVDIHGAKSIDTVNVTVRNTSNVLPGYRYQPNLVLSGLNYTDIPSNSSLQLTQFSIALWFKTDDNLSLSSEKYIMNKGGKGSNVQGKNMNYGISMIPKGKLVIGIENADGESFVTFPTIPRFNDSKWHYAIATYDGSVLNLYTDGKQVGTKQTFGAVPDNTGSQPLRIGANSLSPGGFFIGNVDEVRIW
ncbi:MAG: metallophosphoesterase, partial [Nitrosopumilus sp.]|nr:metallophosphoesterase [Nitrosopumilus sp.]